jgi:hypothetical protein
MDCWKIQRASYSRSVEWAEFWDLQKDLIYLIHMCLDDIQDQEVYDWDWPSSHIFKLKYWEYIAMEGPYEDEEQRLFISSTCLLWVLGLTMQLLKNGWDDNLLSNKVSIYKYLKNFKASNEKEEKIFLVTFSLFKKVCIDSSPTPNLDTYEMNLAYDVLKDTVDSYYKERINVINKSLGKLHA